MLLSVDEALQRIVSPLVPKQAETITLDRAVGRVLAAPVLATLDNPPFDASAMDGYAVRADEVREGVTLIQSGVSQAGKGFTGQVEAGTCVRIFTGAPIPTGADAVVMQEQTTAHGDAITFLADTAPGRNVRTQGHDFCNGDALIPIGTRLAPAHIALIAAANQPFATVTQAPKIAIMATGEELVPPGSPVPPGKIVGSNSFGLRALFSPHAGGIADFGIVPDDMEILVNAIGGALEDTPDILVTTGGASVGEHDLVQAALKANGVEIDFWRIAMRPGKPLMLGRKGNTTVFGLPGNPVSALVTATVFVMPAIRALLGETPPAPLMLPLAESLAPNGPRRHFIRACRRVDASGMTGVAPVGETDSGHLTSLARSDCLIVQLEHDTGKNAGEIVEVTLL
ncbi:molybdopterin molybdotransferase MoeA [Pelagibacterium limicola]|uniref:molybdopterin molybdotransferase MoeA n=1 Tax=Pelagibacterium limicola TaxID=2791022 RepID=UPI0018B012EE|nr:gephyrin-like molybdotransferase Glp [Pelagibacterium limicola]